MAYDSNYWNEIYDSYGINELDIVILFGVESEPQITEITKRLGKENTLVLVSHREIIIEQAMNVVGEGRRVFTITMANQILPLFEKLQFEVCMGKIIYIPACKILRQSKIYLELFTEFRRVQINTQVMKMTQLSFPMNSIRNAALNSKYIYNSYSIDSIKNIYNNQPGVVVSAGAGLQHSLDILKRRDMLIAATAPTLKVLLENNIEPHYATIIDYHPISAGFASDLPHHETPLMMHLSTSAHAVSKYKGCKIINPDALTATMYGIDSDMVCSGSSVAHFAINTLLYAGCNPIYFIGQDLCWLGDETHAKGANLRERKYNDTHWTDWERRMINKPPAPILEANNNRGERVKTSSLLYAYKSTIEDIIRENPDTVFKNITIDGLAIKGAETIHPKQVPSHMHKIKPLELKPLSVKADTIKNFVKDTRSLIKGIGEVVSGLKSVLVEIQAGRHPKKELEDIQKRSAVYAERYKHTINIMHRIGIKYQVKAIMRTRQTDDEIDHIKRDYVKLSEMKKNCEEVLNYII